MSVWRDGGKTLEFMLMTATTTTPSFAHAAPAAGLFMHYSVAAAAAVTRYQSEGRVCIIICDILLLCQA